MAAVGKVIWDGINGGRRGIWKAQAEIAGSIVAKYQLKPVAVRTEITGAAGLAAGAATKRAILWPKRDFPGIPVPHLHFGGKIYPLSDVQWKQFADGVMKDVQTRLAGAGQVQVETLAALSDLTATL